MTISSQPARKGSFPSRDLRPFRGAPSCGPRATSPTSASAGGESQRSFSGSHHRSRYFDQRLRAGAAPTPLLGARSPAAAVRPSFPPARTRPVPTREGRANARRRRVDSLPPPRGIVSPLPCRSDQTAMATTSGSRGGMENPVGPQAVLIRTTTAPRPPAPPQGAWQCLSRGPEPAASRESRYPRGAVAGLVTPLPQPPAKGGSRAGSPGTRDQS